MQVLRFFLLVACVGCSTDVTIGRQRGGEGSGFGSDEVDWVVATTVDDAGNVYVAGHHTGEIDFGGGPLVPTGDSFSTFLASFTASGEHRWSRSFSSTFITFHEVHHSEGRIHTVGLYRGALTTDRELNSPSFQSLLVLEHDTDGNLLSSFDAVGTAGNVQGKSIDRVGSRLAVSGSYVGDVDLGLGALGATMPGRDHGLIGLYDGTAPVLSRAILGEDVINEVVLVDGEGVVGGGRFVGSAELGGGLVAMGPQDAYVAAFNSTGAERFAVHYASTGTAEALDMTRASPGFVVVGSFRGSFVAPEPVDAVGGVDAWVSNLDSDGSVRWLRGVGSAADDQIFAVSRDGSNVVACGVYRDELSVEGVTYPHRGEGDAFAISYDADGDVRWVQTWGSPGADDCSGITAVGSRVIVAGRYSGTLELGETMLTNRGASDVYVLSFSN